jgi:peptide-methionine (S)-S-oxide reductase
MSDNFQIATLAGGCFWCLEAVFLEVKGVQSVVSGYTGGKVANPSYQEVCSGRTDHAEAVQVTFDPNVISYRDVLNVFFAIHDPTTMNRQGADVGTQYRSEIFYHNDDQKKVAEQTVQELNAQHIWDHPIVTQLSKINGFYRAEDYHQDYFARNPYQPYCQAVVAPKVSKFRKQHLELLKKQTA